jgi:hypothetical protein
MFSSFTLFYAPTSERVAKLKAKPSARRHVWDIYVCGTKYAKLHQISNDKSARFESNSQNTTYNT